MAPIWLQMTQMARQKTNLIQYIHSWNQGGIIIINYDISLLQLSLCKNIVNLKNAWLQLFFYNWKRVIHQTGGCNWNCKLTLPFKYLSNTLYTRNSWLQVLFKKNTYPSWNWWPQLLLWNKERFFPEKNCSLRLKAATIKEIFLGITVFDRSLFLWAALSLGYLNIFQYM